MNEIFVSVDIEADGPLPGINSMLSLGAAAYKISDDVTSFEKVATFSANLELAEGASPDEDTMVNFWAKNPEAWDLCRRNPRHPRDVMAEFRLYLSNLPGKPVIVAYPLGYDFPYIYHYLIRYTGSSPIGFTGIDARSYAMAMRRTPFHETKKSQFPQRWFGPQRHTHVAIDDAEEQGEMFCRMYLENIGSLKI